MNPAASVSRSTCASTKSAWPPVASISAATRLPRSTSRSANATFAPSATNRRTVASPMPDAPPVTAAIFPLSRSMSTVSLRCVARRGTTIPRPCRRGHRLVRSRPWNERPLLEGAGSPESDPRVRVRRSRGPEARRDPRAKARCRAGARPQSRLGVNPVDTYLRSNTDNRGPKLPYTPGSGTAGVVEAVGNGVTSVKPGDRVYVGGTASGAYAELSLCGEAQAHPLPARVSFAQGAAMNVPYATAYHALFQRGHGDAGETVLVHGASGGVGIGAVQLARARGMTVFGTAGTAEGRRLVLEQGAHHALDHTAPDYLDELLRLTGGKGVNVVLEMLANVNLAKDLDIVAMHGRIVVIGNRGTIAINPRGAMNKNAAIIGVALFHASPAQLAGIHAALVEGLGNGTLRPVIAQQIPLAQAPRAHEAVMAAGHRGKIVLVP